MSDYIRLRHSCHRGLALPRRTLVGKWLGAIRPAAPGHKAVCGKCVNAPCIKDTGWIAPSQESEHNKASTTSSAVAV